MKGKAWQIVTSLALVAGLGLAGWIGSRESSALAGAALQALESPLAQRDLKDTLKEPYRFVAFGDWGAGTPFQKDVAAQLAKQLEEEPYDAVLMLGDNFYPDGNVRKFGKPYFTDMYPSLIRKGVHFIVAMGNHDELMGHQAEQLSFFKLPGYYYSVKKPGLEILVIDSNTFANDQVQRQWLQKALSASKMPWKIVMGHHPIYSSGEHGMNAGLKKTLEPVLIQHHVDLYLAGHDHDYERFKPTGGVQHIVSGGGGAYLRDIDNQLPNSLLYLKVHHYLSFELKGELLKLKVIDKTGKQVDHLEMKKATMAPVTQKDTRAS